MNDLLQLAVAAHGGIRRWSDFFKLEAALSLGGTLAPARADAEPPKSVWLVADLYKPRVVWSPDDGDRMATDAEWGAEQTSWFSGDAAWSDLIQPFVYTYPGFECEEIAPWEEGGEQWRRLKISAPGSHAGEQTAYFGPESLLRRLDYQLDADGSMPCASYTGGYRNVDGIVVPTRRLICARGEDGQRLPLPPLFTIDIDHIAFA